MATAKKPDRIDPVRLNLEDTGEEFTLEFDRDTVRFAEQRGFDPTDLGRFPMTKVYELFYYSFRMHHKGISRDKTDKIIDNYFGGVGGLPDGLLERLGELYAQPFAALEDKEGKKGKATISL